MDIKDLNLEDLVLYIDKEGEIETLCKIHSLNSNGEWSAQILGSKSIFQGDNNECSIEECLLPIPLTPEVLEKNGFELFSYPYVSYVYYIHNIADSSVLVSFPIENSEDKEIAFSYYSNDDQRTIDELPIKYVHELQHALQLCRIDKEIIL